MILVVNGADFSANKIGNVDIPLELSNWTKGVIAMYPSYNFTDSVKNKLEKFYRTLNSAGLIDKLYYLAMPIFGNSVNEAVKNIISSDYEATIPTDVANVYTQTMGKGLARTGSVSAITSLISLTQPVTPFANDCHFMAYPIDIAKKGNTYATTKSKTGDMSAWDFASYFQTLGFGMGTYGWAQNYVPANTSTFKSPQAYGGSTSCNIILDTNMSFGAYPMLVGSNGTLFSGSINAQEYVSLSADNGYIDGTTNVEGKKILFGLAPYIVDDEWFAKRFAVLSVGKYLTNNESVIYQTALIQLISSI